MKKIIRRNTVIWLIDNCNIHQPKMSRKDIFKIAKKIGKEFHIEPFDVYLVGMIGEGYEISNHAAIVNWVKQKSAEKYSFENVNSWVALFREEVVELNS